MHKKNVAEKFFMYLLVGMISALIGFLFVKFFLMDNVAPFVSNYDGKNYDVRKVGDISSRQTAADFLAQIKEKVDLLTQYMYDNSLPDKEIATRLYTRWKRCQLKETNSSEKSVAFTLNKSTEIRLCIRNGENDFEDPNVSMFVILHELAHVMSVGYGHEEEFMNNFNYIVHLASQLGLYKPENFKQNPKNYCGIEIRTTPCQNDTCEFGGLLPK